MVKRRRRIDSVLLVTLKRNPRLVTRAARRRGGVRVVDESGKLLFSLWIPSTPLHD
jgi:hypothetical protein